MGAMNPRLIEPTNTFLDLSKGCAEFGSHSSDSSILLQESKRNIAVSGVDKQSVYFISVDSPSVFLCHLQSVHGIPFFAGSFQSIHQ
jgi:hypothetical protein